MSQAPPGGQQAAAMLEAAEAVMAGPPSLLTLPEPLLDEILGQLTPPDLLLLAGCCAAVTLQRAVQRLLGRVCENAATHRLPIAMTLWQLCRPALVRLLETSLAELGRPPSTPCRWADHAWVLHYIGIALMAGAARSSTAPLAAPLSRWRGLPRCAIVGLLTKDLLWCAPVELQPCGGGGGGAAAATTRTRASASAVETEAAGPDALVGLEAVAITLSASPSWATADRSFAKCCGASGWRSAFFEA
jgi:hypothetical protein